VSAIVLWWRRRAVGTFGAPPANRKSATYAFGLIGLIVVLGILLPFLGISLLLVLLVERLVLRYIPAAKNFLGLN
jgi:uncharacterized iron-regulated membrane protein